MVAASLEAQTEDRDEAVHVSRLRPFRGPSCPRPQHLAVPSPGRGFSLGALGTPPSGQFPAAPGRTGREMREVGDPVTVESAR